MKMRYRKLMALALSVVMMINSGMMVSAGNDSIVDGEVIENDFTDEGTFEDFEIRFLEESSNVDIPDKYKSVLSTFEGMSIEELNEYIQAMEEEYCDSVRGVNVPTDNVEQAWLAAAEIAERAGYPCAATLVRYSVYGLQYSEGSVSGTVFCPKIMSTSLYSDYVSNIKNGLAVPNSWEITSSINSDLFFALHNVDISYSTSGVGSFRTYYITISDTFDFDYDNDYDSLFVTLVNNWAWLCQQADILQPIKVQLSFVE